MNRSRWMALALAALWLLGACRRDAPSVVPGAWLTAEDGGQSRLSDSLLAGQNTHGPAESSSAVNGAARSELSARWLTIGPPADSPPVEDYWLRVDEALKAIRQARHLSPSQRTPVLARVADQLEPITSVTLAGGQTAPVDNAALVAALRAGAPDIEQIEARVAALAQARLAWPHPPTHPGAFDKLAEILARPEFQPIARRPPSPVQQWWETFNRWLSRLLARLFSAAKVYGWGTDGVLVLIGALTLAGVAYFFWRNVRAHLVREAALVQDAAESNGWSAVSAARQARTLAAGADYRQAIRYLYLAALLTLDERGVLRYDQALTNREVLRCARQSDVPTLAQAMSPVVDTFDRVWYGFAPVDDETYRAYTEQIKQVTEVKRDA